MRKNLFIVLAVLTGLVISMTACILGDDIDSLEEMAIKDNLGKTVNIAAIQGVTAPVNLGTPVTRITENPQYSGTIEWSSNNDSDFKNANSTFKYGKTYKATITLTAKKGFTLRLVKANFFTVTGATSVTNKADSGVITAEFPSATVGVINIAAIPGVTVPVPGGTPVSTITNTAQYSGTVTWSPTVNGTFASDTTYTATINLTPSTGYTLTGVAANFFTVANAITVSNSANSGVITATFPQPSRIEYYWVDQHGSLVTTSGGVTSITTGSSLTITSQIPQGQSYSVKKWYVNGIDTGQTGSTYIFSITTIGKHTVDLFLEKGGKLYNTSITIEVKSNVLTINTWADGSFTTSSGEQWFKFTATANPQYIHASFGTLNASYGLYVQLYDSSGSTVGSQIRLYSSNSSNSLSVASGNEYYIKVTPYSGGGGTYQIAFSTVNAPPLSSNALQADTLTANVWKDGTVSSTGEQWFKFTATSSTQYIHASFVGTLSSSNGMYVQVYNSSGSTVVSQTRLYYSSTNIYWSSATSGQMYYIKVTPYSVYTGTYQITFNTNSNPPLPSNALEADTLTAGVWTEGTVSSTDEQWFKFEATSSTQYIHASFGTLSSSYGMYVQVYNSSGGTVVSQTRLSSGYGTYAYWSSATSGSVYYIKVTSYSGYTGTYKITFSTSYTPPVALPSTATTLTVNTWANGSITTSSGEQWFKFTATASTQYIHVALGTMNDLYVQVYDSSGSMVGNQTELYGSGIISTSRTLSSGQTYYIKVTPYYSSGSGSYQIAFNTSSTPPLPSNSSTATTLTANTWANGNITTSSGEQWFKFTPTSNYIYIYINLGTLTDLYIQVYDSNGSTVGYRTEFYYNGSITQSVTIGQTYYIRVTPYYSSGTYKIAFNTSGTRPN